MTQISNAKSMTLCYFKPWTNICLLIMFTFIKPVGSEGTIRFTSQTAADFQAEVKINGVAALNIRGGWQIVLTFSDPITDITNVSIQCF